VDGQEESFCFVRMEAVEEVLLVGLGGGRSTGDTNAADAGAQTASGAATGAGSTSSDAGIHVLGFKPSAPSISVFKESATGRNGLAVVGAPSGIGGSRSGDYVAAVQGSKKRSVKFWRWKKELPLLSSTTPEALGPLTVTGCGGWVIAGGASGTCYLWNAESGDMVRAWKSHYLAVTCLKVVDDDSMLLSTSSDAIVRAWSIADLLDISVGTIKPMVTLSDHTLAVTGLWVGKFGFTGRIITTSLDHSLKLWFLHNGKENEERSRLLRSAALPCPLNCCVADALESFAFAGGSDGRIFEVQLREGLHDQHVVGAKRSRSAAQSYSRVLEGHTAAVTCLTITIPGTLLASGSLDGSIRLWDTYSGQAVKTVYVGGGSRVVVSLLSVPLPQSIAHGHGSGGAGSLDISSASAHREKAATIPTLKPLNRYQNANDEGGDDASKEFVRFRPTMTSVTSRPADFFQLVKGSGLSTEDGSNATVISIDINGSSAVSGVAAPSKIDAASEDASELLEENKRWKRASTKLYDLAVENLLSKVSH